MSKVTITGIKMKKKRINVIISYVGSEIEMICRSLFFGSKFNTLLLIQLTFKLTSRLFYFVILSYLTKID